MFINNYQFTIEGELTDLNTYINAERAHRQMAARIKKTEPIKKITK